MEKANANKEVYVVDANGKPVQETQNNPVIDAAMSVARDTYALEDALKTVMNELGNLQKSLAQMGKLDGQGTYIGEASPRIQALVRMANSLNKQQGKLEEQGIKDFAFRVAEKNGYTYDYKACLETTTPAKAKDDYYQRGNVSPRVKAVEDKKTTFPHPVDMKLVGYRKPGVDKVFRLAARQGVHQTKTSRQQGGLVTS